MRVTLLCIFRNFFKPGDNIVSHLVALGLLLYVLSVTLAFANGAWIIDGKDSAVLTVRTDCDLIHETNAWKGFFEKPNWYLFPFFLLTLGGLTIANMRYFRRAWHSLAINRTIFKSSDTGERPIS